MRAERLLPLVPMAGAAAYLYFTERLPNIALGLPIGPRAFPRLLGIALAIGAVLWFLETLKEGREEEAGSIALSAAWSHVWLVAGVVAWTMLYYLVFVQLGYLLSTLAFLLPLMLYFNRGRAITNVLTSVLFAVGSYLLFTDLLGVPLARGILPF
jgi:putative tricarboxylic transport membrane protein